MIDYLTKNYKDLIQNCKHLCLLPIAMALLSCSSTTQNATQENAVNNPLATKTTLAITEEEKSITAGDTKIHDVLAEQFGLADEYMINGAYQAASQLLNHFDPEQLDSVNRQNLILLQTKLALLSGNPADALNWLKTLEIQDSTSNNQLIEIHKLKIQALYRANQPFSSALARIELSQLLAPEQKEANNLTIWQSLMSIDYSNIQYNFPHQTQESIRDWLSLALIAKRDANDFNQLSNSLNTWQSTHADSPAIQLLNNYQPKQGIKQNTQTSNKLAVLLPLSGKFAGLGQATQLGIIDSYYSDNSNTRPSGLHFYDTNTYSSMSALYQQALKDGSTFIIGPLTKENVEKFASQYDGSIPMMSLNYLPDSGASSFYQFGLSPADEASQAAKLAWRLGKSKAMIISPENNWGKTTKQSFITQWSSLGGNIVDEYNYTTTDKLSENIAKHLGITDSNWRKYLIEKTIGEKTDSMAQRRQDIDMIFLISTPETARQIKPLLKFYYANDIPVFATSSIYTGISQSKTDRDLNGIYFCDTTWLLNPTSQMKKDAAKYKKAWGNDYIQNSRLHSLGADAYLLSKERQHLALLPDFPIVGNTGNIFVSNQNRLTRKLTCATFKNGVPRVTE